MSEDRARELVSTFQPMTLARRLASAESEVRVLRSIVRRLEEKDLSVFVAEDRVLCWRSPSGDEAGCLEQGEAQAYLHAFGCLDVRALAEQRASQRAH
jgi:hypothetical protein